LEQADDDQEMFSPDSRDAGSEKYDSSFIDDDSSPEHDDDQEMFSSDDL
jgi:hypothetical protein